MARTWLAWILMLTPGCIVADPPAYEERAKTSPMLDLSMADPPITEVIAVDTTAARTIVPFNIPVRSEDAGDELMALFYLSFGQEDQTPQYRITEEPASTFDDANRVISLEWDYHQMDRGCHQLTLVVTHRANFDLEKWLPTDPADVALATWWVNVDDDPAQPNRFSDCPSHNNGGG